MANKENSNSIHSLRIFGDHSDNTLVGSSEDEYLKGKGGNDSLYGDAGADRLEGGRGNDLLDGGAGDDFIDGGTGYDTLEYAAYDVRDYTFTGVNSTQSGSAWTITNTATGETDQVSNVEQANFSNTSIFLDGSNNGPLAIEDTASIDENTVQFFDVAANDWDFESDALTLLNTLSIASSKEPAVSGPGIGTVSVIDNQIQWNPGSDYDYLAVGEQAEVVISYEVVDNNGGLDSSTLTLTITGATDNPAPQLGTDGDDYLGGYDYFNPLDSHLIGLAGNDTLAGYYGDDRLEGGDGDDFLIVYDLSTADYLDGGAGIDRAKLSNVQTTEDIALGADSDGKLAGSIGGATLNINDIEWLSVFSGGSGDDRVDVSGLVAQQGSSLSAGTGNDSLTGGDYSDSFYLQDLSAADYIDGGGGIDHARLSDSNTTENIVLAADSDGNLAGTIGGVALNINSIEALTYFGGGAGNDSVDVSGLSGQESTRLSGGTGNDSLTGGASNDIFHLEDLGADDYLDGGGGVDRASLSAGNTTEDIVLSANANGELQGSIGGVALAISSVELLTYFSGGSGNDSIDVSGLSGQEDAGLYAALYGGTGNDNLTGAAATDYLSGGSGDDILEGGEGSDSFVFIAGDTGTDTVRDFSVAEGDVLSLQRLLADSDIASEDGTTLDAYLNFSVSGADAILAIDIQGDGSAIEQTIVLTGQSALVSGLSDVAIINDLIGGGNLSVI
ncbi:hypothetical protein A9Q89_06515 [Gammaproteobacteria bacterium 53_120_T64]|nr:hypothetical protein A9Q89_06515 [Gammaproteobacteria bacterium 53_120_T64]